MSYTVRGMCGDSAKVEEAFASLEEARVLFEQLKTSDRYSSVELDDITDPDNPDMVDIVELGGGEEEEDEKEEAEEDEEEEVEMKLRGVIEAQAAYIAKLDIAIAIAAQAAYIAKLDIAIAAEKATLATLRGAQGKNCSVCGKNLRGVFRTSGQGLCATCQPVKCTEEGCETSLKKDWRFVGKCRAHGGREGV